MKRLTWVTAVLMLCLAFCASCRQKYRVIAFEDLEQRKPFKALVADAYVAEFPAPSPTGTFVMIALKTESGERVALGGERASADLVRFAKSLEKGKTYEFPKTWLDHKAMTNQVGEVRN